MPDFVTSCKNWAVLGLCIDSWIASNCPVSCCADLTEIKPTAPVTVTTILTATTTGIETGTITHIDYENNENLEWPVTPSCQSVRLISTIFDTEPTYDYDAVFRMYVTFVPSFNERRAIYMFKERYFRNWGAF